MSISSITSNIDRTERDIATLKKQKSNETNKEIRLLKTIDSLTAQANKATSTSSLNSKLNQIRSKQTEMNRVEKKKADLSKKIADKNKQLRKYQIDLTKEQERERKKREREQLSFQRTLNSEMEKQKRLTQETLREQNHLTESSTSISEEKIIVEYDVFISHSSEDKEDFVRPLTLEMQSLGIKVWYDEFELKLGDSLRRTIDKGLINSKYGIVVLSTSFFKRNWTQYELDGFVNREMNGMKVILPIWHKVSKDEVQKFSPSLADKVALNSSVYSIKEIAEEINTLLKK
tara:strand:- start:1712 stop:2578 length:867 start_codon:yes stop_codon:yes gene_type:complete